MNLDQLTYGELKQIADIVGAAAQPQAPQAQAAHPFVGMYVIARCYAAGVHAGTVISAYGENAILKDSRRLWSWKAKDGVALSGVAQNGLKSEGKVDTLNPLISLTGICELIPCSTTAQQSIHDFK